MATFRIDVEAAFEFGQEVWMVVCGPTVREKRACTLCEGSGKVTILGHEDRKVMCPECLGKCVVEKEVKGTRSAASYRVTDMQVTLRTKRPFSSFDSQDMFPWGDRFARIIYMLDNRANGYYSRGMLFETEAEALLECKRLDAEEAARK